MSAADASNPITSVASNPITSVAPGYAAPGIYSNQASSSRSNLDSRGRIFPVERETLMLSPESVSLGLFPQGSILSKPASWDGGDDGVFTVDFDPDCFQYILDFWADAQASFYGTPTSPGSFHAQQNMPPSPTSDPHADVSQNPLLTKQAIIVSREELEYFSITTPGAPERVDEHGLANEELRALKRAAGEALASKRQIFTALQRNVNKENNQAEQHSIDMSCMSGFNRDDEWGFRACEPNRNVISSMALVLLKTGIIHPGMEGAPADLTVPIIDDKQMGTAQKSSLFWRKPARKCWWDGVEVDVPVSDGSLRSVKCWARRVWTLELSLL